MSRFDRLPIPQQDRERLAQSGISSYEKLWAKVDELQGKHGGNCLTELSTETAIPPERLREILANAAKAYGDPLTKPGYLMHFRSLVILAAVALFLASAYWARPEANLISAPVIAGGKTIPAFQPLAPSDLVVKKVPFQPKTFSGDSEVVGRYAAVPLQEHTVLTTDMLSAAAASELAGRTLLPATVTSLPPGSTSRLPVKVSLLLAPKRGETAAPGPVNDAWLVAETRRDDTSRVLLALQPADVERIRPFLAVCDLVLTVQTVP